MSVGSIPPPLWTTFLAAVLVAACARDQPRGPVFEVPGLESWTGEPQVAAKIQEARSKVLEAPRSAAAVGRLGMVFHAHDLPGS